MGEYPVGATATTFEIIEALDEAGTAGSTELADRLGLSKGGVHNHLATLERLGVAINEDGRYRLSLQFLDYGSNVRERIPVVSEGGDVVHSLSSQSGSTTFLVVPEREVAVYAYAAAAGGTERSMPDIRPGTRVQLHACAPGKAVLSTRSSASIEAYLETAELTGRTSHTITDRDALREELQSVRDRGIAFDRGEAFEEMHSVAAPITDDGTAVGALGVVGDATRLSGKRLHEDLPGLVLNHATTLELALTD